MSDDEDRDGKKQFTADDFVKFIFRMTEYIGPKERYGVGDDVLNSGFYFDEMRPDGTPSHQFKSHSSLIDIIRHTEAYSLLAVGIGAPLRVVESAIGTSKSLYNKFREQLREETRSILNKPFVYNKDTSSDSERDRKSNNTFGENLIFKEDSDAEYTMTIRGKLKDGSGIVRRHSHAG